MTSDVVGPKADIGDTSSRLFLRTLASKSKEFLGRHMWMVSLSLGHGLLGDLDDDGGGAEVGLGVDGLHGDGVRDQPLVGVVHTTELDRIAALQCCKGCWIKD